MCTCAFLACSSLVAAKLQHPAFCVLVSLSHAAVAAVAIAQEAVHHQEGAKENLDEEVYLDEEGHQGHHEVEEDARKEGEGNGQASGEVVPGKNNKQVGGGEEGQENSGKEA